MDKEVLGDTEYYNKDLELKHSLWDEAFCYRGKPPVTKELKVVLFLYLMTHHADYGYDISSKFKEAIKSGKWRDRRGLGDLKYENKVEAALKEMERESLIFKYSELKKQIPPVYFFDNKTDDETIQDPRRNYYAINPHVFYHITVNTTISCLFNKYTPDHFVIDQGLRFIQDYNKDRLKVIEFINKIPKLDFLTVLITTQHIWNLAGLHHVLNISEEYKDNEYKKMEKEVETLRKKDISNSFFNDGKKFEKLKNNYISSNVIPTEDFWQFHSEFLKVMGKRITSEVYFNRVYREKS